MYEEHFGFSYFRQKHAERLQEAERARLIRCIEAATRRRKPRRSAAKRVMAATGAGLVMVGSKLQAAGAQ
jgi:hypothetical protein